MTDNLGRISELKIALDTLNLITKAVKIIHDETSIFWTDTPELAISEAKKQLERLKK